MFLTPLQLGILAACCNGSVLVFNVGFTQSEAISELDPNLWTSLGQLLVLVWGVAYVAAGYCGGGGDNDMMWYAFVFEKTIYVSRWIYWHHTNHYSGLSLIQEALQQGGGEKKSSSSLIQVLAPILMCTYGALDFVFAILFWQMGNHLRQKKQQQQQQQQQLGSKAHSE
eukprot:scaffold612_cov98-Cylindrotheca_fusiformis.AAC.6